MAKNKQISTLPYQIKDTKNHTAYYALLFGIQTNNLTVIQSALKSGANLTKLFIDEESTDLTDRQYDEDYTDFNFKYISALDYCSIHSKAHIFEFIASQFPVNKKIKTLTILKSIVAVKQYCSDEVIENLKRVISENITKKNVNELYEVKSLSNPFEDDWYGSKNKTYKATLLHIACYRHNVELVQQLLATGADPNIKFERTGQTPAHITIDETPSKGDQTSGIKILTALLNAGANFDLIVTKETSPRNRLNCWEYAINRFKIPELKKIFAGHVPKNLAIIDKIKIKSKPLYDVWFKQSKGFQSYPLLNDMVKYENRKVTIYAGISEVSGVQTFFKHKSLKTGLQKRYGLSSPRLTKVMNEKLLIRSEKTLSRGAVVKEATVDASFLQKADFLKSLFLTKSNYNSSDFLDLLESDAPDLNRTIDDLTRHRRFTQTSTQSINSFVKMMKNNFTDSQIKEILMKDSGHLQVDDTLDMYNNFTSEYQALLKHEPYHAVNDLVKIHDFFAAKVEMMEQENFKLEQETKFPALKKVGEIKMPTDFGIIVAQENYDLIRWGTAMDHCVGGGDYGEEAKNGDTIIIAITHQTIPKYCIEINPNGKIEQIQGKSRSVPSKEVLEPFITGLQEIKLVKKSEKVSTWIN